MAEGESREDHVYLQTLLEDIIHLDAQTGSDDSFGGVFVYLAEVLGKTQKAEDSLYNYAITSDAEYIVDVKINFKDALKHLLLSIVSSGINIDEVLDTVIYELIDVREAKQQEGNENGKTN